MAQNTKCCNLIKVLEIRWSESSINVQSTNNDNSGATGSLRHFMLKVFCAILKTAPFSVYIFILVNHLDLQNVASLLTQMLHTTSLRSLIVLTLKNVTVWLEDVLLTWGRSNLLGSGPP